MQLTIKDQTSGKTFTIEAEPTDRIHDIKIKIGLHKEGIPPNRQCLTFDGTELTHGYRTLTGYKIQDEATLNLGERIIQFSIIYYHYKYP